LQLQSTAKGNDDAIPRASMCASSVAVIGAWAAAREDQTKGDGRELGEGDGCDTAGSRLLMDPSESSVGTPGRRSRWIDGDLCLRTVQLLLAWNCRVTSENRTGRGSGRPSAGTCNHAIPATAAGCRERLRLRQWIDRSTPIIGGTEVHTGVTVGAQRWIVRWVTWLYMCEPMDGVKRDSSSPASDDDVYICSSGQN
jgi:hypothetical protein